MAVFSVQGKCWAIANLCWEWGQRRGKHQCDPGSCTRSQGAFNRFSVGWSYAYAIADTWYDTAPNMNTNQQHSLIVWTGSLSACQSPSAPGVPCHSPALTSDLSKIAGPGQHRWFDLRGPGQAEKPPRRLRRAKGAWRSGNRLPGPGQKLACPRPERET